MRRQPSGFPLSISIWGVVQLAALMRAIAAGIKRGSV